MAVPSIADPEWTLSLLGVEAESRGPAGGESALKSESRADGRLGTAAP